MGFRSTIKRCVGSVRDHGALITTKSYWRRLLDEVQERRLGIQSRDIITLSELGLEHEDRRECWSVPFQDFRAMSKFLRPQTEEEVFIDYGCGLGRAVILAAMLPFKRVMGVEISTTVSERARENLTRCRGKLRCSDVQIVTADAMIFKVPADATTFFFNNPFAGTVLRTVLTKIKESYGERCREIKLLCYLPPISAFEDQVRQTGGLQLVHSLALSDGRKCLVFAVAKEESTGSASKTCDGKTAPIC